MSSPPPPPTHSPPWSRPPNRGSVGWNCTPAHPRSAGQLFSSLAPRGEGSLPPGRCLIIPLLSGGTPEQGENRDKQNPADKGTLSFCSPAPRIKD